MNFLIMTDNLHTLCFQRESTKIFCFIFALISFIFHSYNYWLQAKKIKNNDTCSTMRLSSPNPPVLRIFSKIKGNSCNFIHWGGKTLFGFHGPMKHSPLHYVHDHRPDRSFKLVALASACASTENLLPIRCQCDQQQILFNICTKHNDGHLRIAGLHHTCGKVQKGKLFL